MDPQRRGAAPRKLKKKRIRRQQTAAGGYGGQGTVMRRIRNTIKKEDESKIGFSDLPPELRNVIYRYALVGGPRSFISLSFLPKIGIARAIAYNLLNTCKAIQNEATAMFYNQNSFCIDLLYVSNYQLPLELQYNVEKHNYGWETGSAYLAVEKLCIERELAQLTRLLQWISPKKLALMKSFLFAYHQVQPAEGLDITHMSYAREPEVGVQLELLRGKGGDLEFEKGHEDYFAMCYNVKGDDVPRGGAADARRARLRPYWASVIEDRCLRRLSKRDLLDLAWSLTFQEGRF